MLHFRPVAVALFLLSPALLHAGEPFRYPAGKVGDKAELKYVHGVPVLTASGGPDDLGAAVGALALKPSPRLLDYPLGLLKEHGAEGTWGVFARAGAGLLKQCPADYVKEIDAVAKAADADRERVVVANTFFDLKSVVACSAALVEPQRSATGGPLFGRNLDYPSLGYIHEHTLVTVYRPEGKHAFASVGFPGLVGVLSGMNDAGLCMAVLEVYDAKDGEPHFDAAGVPYALCNRKLLEECTTIAEAKKLLEKLHRTCILNLAVADKTDVAVFEVTPKRVVQRSAEQGLCSCTNHFVSDAVKASDLTDFNRTLGRFDDLEKLRACKEKLTVEDLHKQLDAVNLAELTLQTMVFEPAALRLHLAFGERPASKGELKTVELGPLFKGAGKKDE
jgi:predicted choloylglycine hydrolase